MEKNNLIKRKENINDLRLKQIILTSDALNKINDIKKQIKKLDKLLEKDISKEDLEIFYKVTNQIKNNIKEDKYV